MDRREHPRIQIPLLVELSHPSIGRQNCVARDISEGGVFVQIDVQKDVPSIREGASVRLVPAPGGSVVLAGEVPPGIEGYALATFRSASTPWSSGRTTNCTARS